VTLINFFEVCAPSILSELFIATVFSLISPLANSLEEQRLSRPRAWPNNSP